MMLSNGVKCSLRALLAVAVAALYGQFLWNPIVFDDIHFFLLNPDGTQPISSYTFKLLELRSLPYATLAWTKAAFGVDLIYFRLGNLLLHAMVVLALFAFLRVLFDAIYVAEKDRLNSTGTAFFAALLFALHPVSTFAAGYLVQRTIVMATLFCLLAMWAYVVGSVKSKPLWLWACVPLYYLAEQSKEHAIMLPAALVALTVLLHSDWRAQLIRRWAIFAGLAAVALLVLLVKQGIIGSMYEPVAEDMLARTNRAQVYPLSVLTQSWLFFKYAWLWLFPNPMLMSIDMREPFATALISWYLLSMLVFVLWGIGAGYLLLKRGKWGLVGFALLYPWLMFMTEFSAVRVQEVFVLYRSYLWVVGGFCLLPVVVSGINARLASFVLGVIALALVPMSMDRLVTMSHPLFVWDDAAKLVKDRDDLPGAYRIYYNRGTERIHAGFLDQAIVDLEKSMVLNPQFGIANVNLAIAYTQRENWPKAAETFSKAILWAEAGGGRAKNGEYFGRAQAYEHMGDFQKALSDYKESCRLDKKGCSKSTMEGLVLAKPVGSVVR